MSSFWHDLKVAARMARTKPAFSAMIIGMLALAIAGNTAIFSIFNGLILRPLPFAAPDRLMDVDETAPKWNLSFVGISNPDYFAWEKGNRVFDGLAAFSSGGVNLSDKSGVLQRIRTANVTHNLLPVLGLSPSMGRNFRNEEDRPGGPQVILLGYDLWQSLYRGDRAVVGRIVKLSEQPFTIIGVLPREAVWPVDAQAWVPLAADPIKPSSYYLSCVGRLKPGVSRQQAREDLLRIHKSLIGTAGHSGNIDTSPILTPLRDRALGDLNTVARILLGAVAVVLLIACVNIAGLMLVQGEARSREMAIRTAVGASRPAIIRQLLTESLLLATIGGAAGVLLGKSFLMGLISLFPEDVPRWIRFDMDWRFALFSIAITGGAALLFGLAPALHAASVEARGCIQEMGRATSSRAKRSVLSSLVVGEIALALILLSAAGLVLQAFEKAQHVDPGFHAQNVLTWNMRPASVSYPKAEQQYAFYMRLLDRLRALPGVQSASAASLIPLTGHSGYFFEAEGKHNTLPNESNPVTLQITALPGYFQTIGITFLEGRPFDDRDEKANAPKRVIVNESFAKSYWPGQSAVGKRIRYPGNKNHWFEVVGVTRDTKHYGVDREMKPSVFVPFQVNPGNGLFAVVRTSLDPDLLVGPAREVIRQLDPGLPPFDIRTMAARLERSLWIRRVYSWLFAAFAVVAIWLAAAGVYSMISFAVSQRRREIGIRMALGARPSQIMGTILGGGMTLVAIGSVLGLIASLLTARFLQTLLFGVSTRDVATYAAVILSIAAVGFLANYIPARRAAQVDPTLALRLE